MEKSFKEKNPHKIWVRVEEVEKLLKLEKSVQKSFSILRNYTKIDIIDDTATMTLDLSHQLAKEELAKILDGSGITVDSSIKNIRIHIEGE